MKISDYIVSFLDGKGITDVFGYPGGMVTHLMDSFGKQSGRIRAHVNYHEQASAFCACGYAQASGLPGVAYATSGPGATNLITGIANAYFDSIPCLFLTGQVNTYESKGNLNLRQKGFQETDIVSIVRPVTKYASIITAPGDIRYELEKAYHICVSGRPGPVLLDIPMDIQRQDIDPTGLKGFTPESDIRIPDLSRVLTVLEASERPCVIAGAGIKTAGMISKFRELSGMLGVPVVSSMPAVDVLCSGDRNYYGFIGAYGCRKANIILAKSDLIISFGSRLDCRQTGNGPFAPNAKLIRFDVDEHELSNAVKPDELKIHADLRTIIPQLCSDMKTWKRKDYSSWAKVCGDISTRLAGFDSGKPNSMIDRLSRLIPDDVIVTADVGQNQVWLAQSFNFKPNQRLLFSSGHGAMGYSLPAAIGAYYGSGRKKVISFSGDGGIQMNIQELQFVTREKLPIKIVILNNRSLGMIRHFQDMYFDSRHTQTTEAGGYSAPSFEKLAAAYGLPFYRIKGEEGCRADMFEENGPSVIEVTLPRDTYVFPKLSVGNPVQDQEPPLDRTLYDYLMKL